MSANGRAMSSPIMRHLGLVSVMLAQPCWVHVIPAPKVRGIMTVVVAGTVSYYY
jgi:hypothetical protein